MANNENNHIIDCINPQLIIPSSFGECLTYAQQILWLVKKIDAMQDEITALTARVQALEEENS